MTGTFKMSPAGKRYESMSPKNARTRDFILFNKVREMNRALELSLQDTH